MIEMLEGLLLKPLKKEEEKKHDRFDQVVGAVLTCQIFEEVLQSWCNPEEPNPKKYRQVGRIKTEMQWDKEWRSMQGHWLIGLTSTNE